MQKEIMTPKHKGWKKFCDLLEGKEGCNFRKDKNEKYIWNCKGGSDKALTIKILKKHFPKVDIDASILYFEKHGGYCDCEILFNVDVRNL